MVRWGETQFPQGARATEDTGEVLEELEFKYQ